MNRKDLILAALAMALGMFFVLTGGLLGLIFGLIIGSPSEPIPLTHDDLFRMQMLPWILLGAAAFMGCSLHGMPFMSRTEINIENVSKWVKE